MTPVGLGVLDTSGLPAWRMGAGGGRGPQGCCSTDPGSPGNPIEGFRVISHKKCVYCVRVVAIWIQGDKVHIVVLY